MNFVVFPLPGRLEGKSGKALGVLELFTAWCRVEHFNSAIALPSLEAVTVETRIDHLTRNFGLQQGADVNAIDFTGQTALHWTAVRGSIQVAELLLQSGARIEYADSHGYRVRNSLLLLCCLAVAFVSECCISVNTVNNSHLLVNNSIFELIWAIFRLTFRRLTWPRNMDTPPCFTILSRNGAQKWTLLTMTAAAPSTGRPWSAHLLIQHAITASVWSTSISRYLWKTLG